MKLLFKFLSELSSLDFVLSASLSCVTEDDFYICVIMKSDFCHGKSLELFSETFKKFNVRYQLPFIDTYDKQLRFQFKLLSLDDCFKL